MRSLRESSLAMGLPSLFFLPVSSSRIASDPRSGPTRPVPDFATLNPDYVRRYSTRSIHVLQVAPAALDLGDRALGGLRRERFHVGEAAHEHRAHVLGHRVHVA